MRKKYFEMGRLEQPRQNKIPCTGMTSPMSQPRKDPFHLSSLSPHSVFTSRSTALTIYGLSYSNIYLFALGFFPFRIVLIVVPLFSLIMSTVLYRLQSNYHFHFTVFFLDFFPFNEQGAPLFLIFFSSCK